jgi:hypothetical protein
MMLGSSKVSMAKKSDGPGQPVGENEWTKRAERILIYIIKTVSEEASD